MVNIVVVSHSRKLAEGVVELASQMTQGKVKFAIAAGIDDPDNPIGTDPLAVMTAIEQLLDGDVLVLVDMGSAILSTDMAQELLGKEQAARVQVCAAPLVEGAVAAAVAAAAGQGIDQVSAEAHQALVAKYAQLGQSEWLAGTPVLMPAAPESDMESFPCRFSWTITNPTGIHARPAAAIARCLNQFDADVQLVNGARAINAKSMNNVALLAINCGDVITLQARGPQAQAAIDAFAALAATQFGDRPQQNATEQVTTGGGAENAPQSLEVTIRRVEHAMPVLATRSAEAKSAEIARLSDAMDLAKQQLAELVSVTEKQLSAQEAAIFSAQLMMLEDSELVDATRARLEQQAAPVENLWQQVINQLAEEYRAIDDAYLRDRFIDIYDIGWRVLRLLPGQPPFSLPQEPAPVLIIASYLLPSEVMALDREAIKGIYFNAIGAGSHAAILARARGIAVYIDTAQHYTAAWQDGARVTLAVGSGNIVASSQN